MLDAIHIIAFNLPKRPINFSHFTDEITEAQKFDLPKSHTRKYLGQDSSQVGRLQEHGTPWDPQPSVSNEHR